MAAVSRYPRDDPAPSRWHFAAWAHYGESRSAQIEQWLGPAASAMHSSFQQRPELFGHSESACSQNAWPHESAPVPSRPRRRRMAFGERTFTWPVQLHGLIKRCSKRHRICDVTEGVEG